MTFPIKITSNKEKNMSENLNFKFDKGFEQSRNAETVTLKYKDEKVFVENSPLPKEQIKKLDQYRHEFGQKFLQASIEEAKPLFKKDSKLESVVTEVSYGVNKSDKLEVLMQQNVKQTITDFSGNTPPKEITTCRVRVKSKVSSGIPKTDIRRAKDDLHVSLYGEK